jgi:hypothetical protein
MTLMQSETLLQTKIAARVMFYLVDTSAKTTAADADKKP